MFCWCSCWHWGQILHVTTNIWQWRKPEILFSSVWNQIANWSWRLSLELFIFLENKRFSEEALFLLCMRLLWEEIKGVCDLQKRRGESELLLESNRLFLALALCSFPQEHGFLCEKRLFLNYLLFIYLLFRLLCFIQWAISYLWGQYMVPVGAEGREYAQSTPQRWEMLLQ